MWRNPRFYRRPPPTRALDHDFLEPQVFRGGARVCASQWSRPFATLTFDREVAQLAPRNHCYWNRWAKPSPVWILRSEVDLVVRTHGTALTRGIMFAGEPDIYAGVIFLTGDRQGLLDALAAEGWPVEPDA